MHPCALRLCPVSSDRVFVVHSNGNKKGPLLYVVTLSQKGFWFLTLEDSCQMRCRVLSQALNNASAVRDRAG